MRRHLIHFLLVAVLTVCSAATAIAQVTVKGQVVGAGKRGVEAPQGETR